MKTTSILFAATVLVPALASAADHDLGGLAKANKIEVFNRTLDQTEAGSPQAVFLNDASDDGLAWIAGVELSEGTIELEIKGKNQQGRSFVGIAFHVNGSDVPALTVELLNERLKGKVGLWVGNGSDGWFRNLKVIPAGK